MTTAARHGADPTTADAAAKRRVVAVVYFLLFLGPGIALPYLPRYLEHVGLSGWEIGIAIGLQPILRWGSALAFAQIADRWRIRHALLLSYATLGALCFVPFLWVRDFAPMLLVLSAISVLHGPLISAIDACVLDHLPDLGGDYGRLRLWGSISFILGALLAALGVEIGSPDLVPAMLLPSHALLPLALAGMPRPQSGHALIRGAPWRLLTPALTAFLTVVMLVHMSCGAWGGFFALHTERLGMGDWVPGAAFALAVVFEVAIFRWGRLVLERVPAERLLVLVIAVTVARWIATAVTRDAGVLIALQVGHTFTFSALHLAAMHLVPRLVPPQRSTSGQALYGITGFGLGGSIGIALAGAVVEPLGTAGLFLFEAALAAMALPAALQLARLGGASARREAA
jgi:PPP family 3-phenylpropionic acid transporter